MKTIETNQPGVRNAPDRSTSLLTCLAGLALLGATALPLRAADQTNAAPNPTTANRYLLIVETSRATEQRTNGIRQVVADLFTSGLPGQAQAGDTIGVWTFNSDLYAGQVPLLDWYPSLAKTLSTRMLSFLDHQAYARKPSLDKVVPMIQQIVQDSDFITVILLCSGESTIKGTPFDDRINKAFSTWRSQQKKVYMPFVIMLRAEHGKIVDGSAGLAPWRNDLPALPSELVAARAQKALAAQAAKVSQPQRPAGLPPLIITGKKNPGAETAAKALEPAPAQPSAAGATKQSALAVSSASAVPSTPNPTASGGGNSTTTITQNPATAQVSEKSRPAQSPGQPPVGANTLTAAIPAAQPDGSGASASPAGARADSAPATPPTTGAQAENAVTASAPAASGLQQPASLATAPSFSVSNSGLRWMALGFGAGVAGAALLVFWRTRARPRVHMSMITRSFGDTK